jgi:hypothetical protein
MDARPRRARDDAPFSSKEMTVKALTMVLAALAAQASAQAPSVPTEFPQDAEPVPAEALKSRLAGRIFSAKLADGTGWRLEYTDGGYFYVDTTKGFRGTGTWRVEGSQLCTELKTASSGCSEARRHGERLFIKRASGEVIELVPR